jgi:dTDP-4-dehydrorhamnose reductase
MNGTRRMVVTGREGQVVRSLLERGQGSAFEVVALGRPDLDLFDPDRIEAALRRAHPDVIVSAAAYTAVDRAETDEAAVHAANAVAPGRIAAAAASLGVPVVHLSTDYVFDGTKTAPYVEDDPVGPASAYGRTKLSGERAVAVATENHVILRTAWVYSPFGRNFLKTMLHLAESRERIDVVDDQVGNPTSALAIADGILAVAGNLLASDVPQLRGLFHMTGAGEASWADFATEIFAASARRGVPSAAVGRIATSAYPTPARRPANSRLDCAKLERVHGVRLGDWKQAVAETVGRLARSHVM